MISFVNGARLKEETWKFVLKHDIKSFRQERVRITCSATFLRRNHFLTLILICSVGRKYVKLKYDLNFFERVMWF